jgi:integrase
VGMWARRKRARSEDTAHEAARGGAQGGSAPALGAGVLLSGRQSAHAVAGLRRIGSHVLRHTFCSHLAMRGAAPKAVQDLAGHSTLTMTLR